MSTSWGSTASGESDSVASDMAGKVFGRGGNDFVTVLVLVSTLGSMMGMIIGGSRVFFAMGRDRLFFAWAGRVAARTETPAGALATVGVLSAAYTLMGTFETHHRLLRVRVHHLPHP